MARPLPLRPLLLALLLISSRPSIATPQPGPSPAPGSWYASPGPSEHGAAGMAARGARWPFSAAPSRWPGAWAEASPSGPAAATPGAVATGIPDGSGGAIVAVWDWSHGVTAIRVQRVVGAGVPQWGAQGVLVTGSGSDASEPVMASDGAGGAVIAWMESESGSPTAEILVQRVSADGVPQWQPGGVLLTANADLWSSDPAIAPCLGGAIVAWTDRGGYAPFDIYAQRVDASGVVRWVAGGQAVCSAGGSQWAPAIVASGTGGAIIAWTDTRGGTQRDIYAQRLNTSGIPQWAYDGVVVCAEASDQEAPAIVTDGSNGAIVTWSDPRNGTYDLFAQSLTSGGTTLWGDGRPVCLALGDQRSPRAVADGAAGTVVAWEDSRYGNKDVCAQHVLASGDTAWIPAAPVCMAGGDQGEIALAWDGASGAVVAWMDPRAGIFPGVYAQRVSAAGVPQWTPDGLALCPDAVAADRPVVVADGSGGAIVTWEERRGFDLEVYGQRLDGAGLWQWNPQGAQVVADPGVQRVPAQVGDGAGGTIVALHQKLGGVYKVYLRRYDSNGVPQWPWLAACTAPGLQILPSIAADGAGGAIVAWVDGRAGLANGDIYAQRVSAAGSRLWDEGGAALCVEPGLQFQPAIASDGAGGAIVTWMSAVWEGDIYAQRIDGAGVPQWPAGGVSLCSAAGTQTFPDEVGRDVIVSDGSGGAIVAWTDWRNGTDANVHAQRVDALGASLWAMDGVALCTAAQDQGNAVVATDGSGGAIVAWDDKRSGSPAIYAQRVNADGLLQWGVDGTTLSGTTFWGDHPRVLSDGAGGAIIAWTGYGSPSTSADIFAQRVNSAGTRLWTPRDGRALCLAPGEQRDAALTSDGAGGAIVAWVDFRAGESLEETDLFAQRVLSNGTTYWTYNGVPLCTQPDMQAGQVLIPDGAHGVIAAWQDRRDHGKDFVHLQRLSASGSSRWNDGGTVDVAARGGRVAEALAISSVLPNPVRREMTVSFSLSREDAARLELLDVSGRRILSQPLGAPGFGSHSVRVPVPPETAPGVYMLRLIHGGNAASRKVCVLR